MDIKTDWKIERVLEVLLLVFLILAAVGVFGGHPSPSEVKASNANIELKAEYREAIRDGLGLDLDASVKNTGDAPVRKVTLRINRRYFDGFAVRRVIPQPEKESFEAKHLVLSYGDLDPGDTLDVTINLEAEDSGTYPATLEAQFEEPASAAFVRFKTRIYP